MKRKFNHISLILRLSNFELFTLQCNWTKKSPAVLLKLDKYKEKRFAYAFSRVYYKRNTTKVEPEAIKEFEKFISDSLQRKMVFNNLELAFESLKILKLIAPSVSFHKLKIGEVIR